MDRVVRRVPKNFDAVLGRVWPGCIRPGCEICSSPIDRCTTCRSWRPSYPSGAWWQLWETVSDGSPVTPAFHSMDSLVRYLAFSGDRMDPGGLGISAARRIVLKSMAPLEVRRPILMGFVPPVDSIML